MIQRVKQESQTCTVNLNRPVTSKEIETAVKKKKPDDLSLIPQKANFSKLPPDLHICTVVYTDRQTYTHVN